MLMCCDIFLESITVLSQMMSKICRDMQRICGKSSKVTVVFYFEK